MRTFAIAIVLIFLVIQLLFCHIPNVRTSIRKTFMSRFAVRFWDSLIKLMHHKLYFLIIPIPFIKKCGADDIALIQF